MRKLKLSWIAIGIGMLICIANSIQAQEKTMLRGDDRVSKEQIDALDSLQSISGAKLSVLWNVKNGAPTMLSGKLAGKEILQKAGSYENASIEFLKNYRKVLGLESPGEEFKLRQKVMDELGNTHIKLDQYHSGIRVFGAQLIVHFNPTGEVYSINGRYSPSFKISLEPLLSQGQAIQIAVNDAKMPVDSSAVEQLIHIDEDMTHPQLSWNVFLFSKSHPTQQYIIDANDNKILYIDRGFRF